MTSSTGCSPSRPFDPVAFKDFISLDRFERQWRRLKLGDADLKAPQIAIAMAGGNSPVIRGMGDLRKIRFALLASNQGKSSGVRVCYAHFAACGVELLVTVYAKNRQDDLTDDERRAIKPELRESEWALERGPLP